MSFRDGRDRTRCVGPHQGWVAEFPGRGIRSLELRLGLLSGLRIVLLAIISI